MSSTKTTFEKRVISFNDNEYQNGLRRFEAESEKVKDYWLGLNAKLGTNIYKLSDVISFIEAPSILKEVFDKENKSEAVAKAKANGISVEALSGLDSIDLTQEQQAIIDELQKLGQLSIFKIGSKSWLQKEEIVLTEEVEAIYKEMATEYTENHRANDILQIAELVEQFRVDHPNHLFKLRQVLFGKHARVLREFINEASK